MREVREVVTPAGYELDANNYYEKSSVGSGRIMKMCAYCGKYIPKGQAHDVHKFYGDGDWPNYATHKMNPDHGDTLQPGEISCTRKFLNLIEGK